MADSRPLRLGLFDIMQVDPLAEMSIAEMYAAKLSHLAYADELGFDVAFSAERHFMPSFACPSAVSWIAAASQRTSKMRLGVMAWTLPLHAPVQLAEDIAVLDHLSNGRLEAGFGLGHRMEEFTALGVNAGQRISSFQERLAVLQALWSGGQVSYDKGDLKAQDLAIAPVPLQQPYPPLWFAGTEPNAARWCAERGMSLAIGFKPAQELLPTVTAYREGLGGSSGSVALMRAVVVGESDEAARQEIAGHLVRLQVLQGREDSPELRAFSRNQVQTMIDQEVMIAGSAETVADGIAKARELLGFDTFLGNVWAVGASDTQIRRSLALLAGPVRQQLG